MTNLHSRSAIFDIGDTLLVERKLRYEAMEFAFQSMVEIGLIAEGPNLREGYIKKDQKLAGYNVNHLFSNYDMVSSVLIEAEFGNIEHLANCYLSLHREYVNSNVVHNPRLTEMFANIKERGWQIGILTDGTVRDQYFLLNRLGLLPFIDGVSVSEAIGVTKPSPQTFSDILHKLGVPAKRSVMIGNDFERDIQGSLNVGMKAIFLSANVKELDILPVDCRAISCILETEAMIEKCLVV